MPRLHRAIGWSLVALGAIHVLATPLFVPGISEAAVWFGSAGGGLALVGALNLLCADPHALPHLRRLSTGASLGTIVFAAALLATAPESEAVSVARTFSGRFGEPQVYLVLALALAAAWLSRPHHADPARPPA